MAPLFSSETSGSSELNPRLKPAVGHHPERSSGFILVTCLLVLLIISGLLLFVEFQVWALWSLAEDVEGQLHSQVLAENGIELAHVLLPYLDLNELLTGPDGVISGTDFPEWRSPLPLAMAGKIDPATWIPERDDGLPFWQGVPLLPPGDSGPSGEAFLIRFSNNPEEPPDRDEDREVLVRSLGMVRERRRRSFFRSGVNSVSLIEARLRQERSFELSSALTLLGDEGTFDFRGTDFLIQGGNEHAVAIVSFSEPVLIEVVLNSLDESQVTRIQGPSNAPSVGDLTAHYDSRPCFRRLRKTRFWTHFLARLPSFAERRALIEYHAGSTVWTGDLEGILIARGDLTLSHGARLQGLLLHLGEGKLELLGQSRIQGGIWMSNLGLAADAVEPLPLALSVSEEAVILYDSSAINRALALLPPTQISWRLLFPETVK